MSAGDACDPARESGARASATMMHVALSLNHLLDRAGTLFAANTIVSRRPDKSLATHTYGEFRRRARALAAGLRDLGLRPGERVATLSWVTKSGLFFSP